MIIEAGYDLFELFAPRLFAQCGSSARRGTWVLAMDENLRNLHLKKVGGDSSAPIEDRIPRIVKSLTKGSLRPVVYYAVAHLDTGLRDDYSSQFHQFDETLRLAPELIEHELLCTYFSNGKDLYSSGPRYSFRDYVGLEHLPRTATVLGPHKFPCSCPACTQFEAMLKRNRARHQASTSEEV